jgi:hypothetical protein
LLLIERDLFFAPFFESVFQFLIGGPGPEEKFIGALPLVKFDGSIATLEWDSESLLDVNLHFKRKFIWNANISSNRISEVLDFEFIKIRLSQKQ